MTVDNEIIKDLYRAMLKLETLEDCHLFFDDLFTKNELNSIAQRLQVAKLLHNGEKFSEIVERTGASTATISRVNRCLQYGPGGYARILDKV